MNCLTRSVITVGQANEVRAAAGSARYARMEGEVRCLCCRLHLCPTPSHVDCQDLKGLLERIRMEYPDKLPIADPQDVNYEAALEARRRLDLFPYDARGAYCWQYQQSYQGLG
jgi:hypothetical protein